MKRFFFALFVLTGIVSTALADTVTRGDEVINGPLYIVNNSQTTALEFPNLEFVNGPIYIVNNANLLSVELPKLLYVNGPIYITYNVKLGTANYPLLKFANGPVYRYGNKP